MSLKKNISTIPSALSLANNLRGVKFKWKTSKEPYGSDHPDYQKYHYGFIAQEVESVVPELVYENKINDSDIKAIHDGNEINGILIEAIKELTAKVEALEAKLGD